MKNSFVELNARERVHALLDAKSGRELIDPFDPIWWLKTSCHKAMMGSLFAVERFLEKTWS